MSEFIEKSQQLSPDIIERFRLALAQGKWPDGQTVTDSQKDTLIQAIIVYDAAHKADGQRIGELEGECASKTTELNNAKKRDEKQDDKESLIKWQ
ncbi:MAG: DUF1315 family protein [Pseudomonadota bacterium]|nr:DUF1315 family protein [Pseudomonadota bacterium]